RTHGMLLYDSTLRVPLVIAAPGQPARTIDDPVSLSEIAPTILRATGVAPPDVMKGRDLLEMVRLKPDTTETGVAAGRDSGRRDSGSVRLQPDLYSETEYPRVAGWSPLQALTDGRWMAIRAAAVSEVYDLRNDPQELHDIANSEQPIANAMHARIDAIRAAAPKQGPPHAPD